MTPSGLRKGIKKVYFSVLHYAIDNLIAPGDKDYRSFIVLGRPRTGSTLLTRSLGYHPEVLVLGELFQTCDREGFPKWPERFGFRTRRNVESVLLDPQTYLSEMLFRKYPEALRAVGFKIFYGHAKTEKWKPIWTWLEQQEDIRVLHITRRNALRAYVSHELAKKTGQYGASPRKPSGTRPSITLDYDAAASAFSRMRAEEESFASRFSSHLVMDLSYENLSADFDDQMRRVQSFIGVDVKELPKSTRKQEDRPLSGVIVNYDSMKARFSGSEWEAYFDD